MQQKKNPLLIVLAACGGCLLLGVICLVVAGYFVKKSTSGLMSGTINMMTNMPKFLGDIKSSNYAAASTLIDPSVQDKYTADKLQSIEANVEKKLGPLQSYPRQFSKQNQTTNTDTSKPGSMPTVAFTYTYPLTYKKGAATATFEFESKDVFHPSGLITDFKIEPDTTTKSN